MSTRNTAIEIHINDITQIPTNVLDGYDVEYSAKEKADILWIYNSEKFKKFDRSLFEYLEFVKKVVNREAVKLGLQFTDYLNIYIESDDVGEFGVETETKKYRNIRFAELGEIDTNNILLKKEI